VFALPSLRCFGWFHKRWPADSGDRERYDGRCGFGAEGENGFVIPAGDAEALKEKSVLFDHRELAEKWPAARAMAAMDYRGINT